MVSDQNVTEEQSAGMISLQTQNGHPLSIPFIKDSKPAFSENNYQRRLQIFINTIYP